MGFGLRRGIISSGVLDATPTPTFAGDTDITDFDASLAHVYELEESSGTIADQVGSLSSTTSISGNLSTTTGKYNEAINNSNSATSGIAFASEMVDCTANFAISFWAQHDGTQGFGDVFFQNQTSNPICARVGIDGTTGEVNFAMQNTIGGTFFIAPTSAGTASVYHHVVATLQTNTLQLWVNGSSAGTATFSGSHPVTNFTRMFQGIFNSGDVEIYKGDIDEFYVWEGLTFGSGKPSEADFVAALYNSGTGTFYGEES